MTQKEYHWRRYTRPLIVLLTMMMVPTYLVFFAPAATIIYLIAGMFYLFGLWFYIEEIHPYKNSLWTEPLTWEDVQQAENAYRKTK